MLSKLKSMFQHSLKTRPLLTNYSVYASFYTAAEFSQQTFNKYYTPAKPDYNFKSGARIVAVGSTVFAPTLYYWYKFLDRTFVGTAPKTVVKKVCCEQFMMTPFLLAVFFTVLGILEGREDVFAELKQKYLKTLLANQSFWLPVQSINFALIPPHMRVTYVSIASFIWINVLCYIKRQQVTTVDKIADKIPKR